MKKPIQSWKPIKLFYFLLLLSTSKCFSQTAYNLVFQNPILESGIAGQNNAKYRFNNATSNLDAVIEIIGRSSSAVSLSSIDTTGAGLGYDFAFQPVLGIAGTAPANSTWSMDFKLSFFQAGTNNIVISPKFQATGIDIDGDASTLNEWTIMKKIVSIDSATINNLTFTKIATSLEGDEYKVEGIIANSPGIDTTAKNVSATYNYIDKGEIYFAIGAKTTGGSTSAGMRLNSLWFRNFYFEYSTPLPVHLVRFTGNLNRNNSVTLNWTVADNETVDHFEIERSVNGKNFSTVAMILATEKYSTEDYQYAETINSNDKVMYRLKMFDKGQNFDYSKILVFQPKSSNTKEIKILGNPVNDKLTFSYISNETQTVNVKVYDMTGKVSMSQKVNSLEGSNIMSLPLASTFTPGMYVVEVTNGTDRQIAKFVKQ